MAASCSALGAREAARHRHEQPVRGDGDGVGDAGRLLDEAVQQPGEAAGLLAEGLVTHRPSSWFVGVSERRRPDPGPHRTGSWRGTSTRPQGSCEPAPCGRLGARGGQASVGTLRAGHPSRQAAGGGVAVRRRSFLGGLPVHRARPWVAATRIHRRSRRAGYGEPAEPAGRERRRVRPAPRGDGEDSAVARAGSASVGAGSRPTGAEVSGSTGSTTRFGHARRPRPTSWPPRRGSPLVVVSVDTAAAVGPATTGSGTGSGRGRLGERAVELVVGQQAHRDVDAGGDAARRAVLQLHDDAEAAGEVAGHVVPEVPGRRDGEALLAGEAPVGPLDVVGGHAEAVVGDGHGVAGRREATLHLDRLVGRREGQGVLDQLGEHVGEVGGDGAGDRRRLEVADDAALVVLDLAEGGADDVGDLARGPTTGEAARCRPGRAATRRCGACGWRGGRGGRGPRGCRGRSRCARAR